MVNYLHTSPKIQKTRSLYNDEWFNGKLVKMDRHVFKSTKTFNYLNISTARSTSFSQQAALTPLYLDVFSIFPENFPHLFNVARFANKRREHHVDSLSDAEAKVTPEYASVVKIIYPPDSWDNVRNIRQLLPIPNFKDTGSTMSDCFYYLYFFNFFSAIIVKQTVLS